MTPAQELEVVRVAAAGIHAALRGDRGRGVLQSDEPEDWLGEAWLLVQHVLQVTTGEVGNLAALVFTSGKRHGWRLRRHECAEANPVAESMMPKRVDRQVADANGDTPWGRGDGGSVLHRPHEDDNLGKLMRGELLGGLDKAPEVFGLVARGATIRQAALAMGARRQTLEVQMTRYRARMRPAEYALTIHDGHRDRRKDTRCA